MSPPADTVARDAAAVVARGDEKTTVWPFMGAYSWWCIWGFVVIL